MTWLLSITVAFLTLGITEAVIKPLAKWFIERRIRAALPALFEVLDPMMPRMIQQYRPGELEQIVRAHLTTITGQDWSHEDIEPFFRLYDPRRNAERFQ
jgi:hypothetical protein